MPRSNPFIDSLLTDSLNASLRSKFNPIYPQRKIGKQIDPFDPFAKETFLRRGLGKFWFFIISILILGLILYFRNTFPNQLLLRIRSLFNAYYFRELVSDFGISFTTGSVVAWVIGMMVMAQTIVLIIVYAGYVALNSFVLYLVILFGLIVWKVFIFFLQNLQAYVLDILPIVRNQTQRQINIDLLLSLIFFPMVVFAYFNSSKLVGINVSYISAIALSIWVGLRLLLELLGIIREGSITFSGILYFCGFEILPHVVLVTALFRNYGK